MAKRKPKAPPIPGVLWLFLGLFLFLASLQFSDAVYAVGYDDGHNSGVQVGQSFKQQQIQALADLMQQRNAKLYRAKAELYARVIFQECERQGIGHLQLVAQIIQESGLKEDVTGGVGEIGLMQICPWWLEHYEKLGLEPCTKRELYDPVNNIRWGVAILARCMNNTHGDIYKALCFYNAGVKWQNGRRYAEKILRLRSMLEKALAKKVEA